MLLIEAKSTERQSVWASVLIRTAGMIYLFASATSRFDRTKLAGWEIMVRLGLAALLVAPGYEIHLPAAVAALTLVLIHQYRQTNLKQAA